MLDGPPLPPLPLLGWIPPEFIYLLFLGLLGEGGIIASGSGLELGPGRGSSKVEVLLGPGRGSSKVEVLTGSSRDCKTALWYSSSSCLLSLSSALVLLGWIFALLLG